MTNYSYAGQQLPLGVALRDDGTLETYYPGDNQEALAQLKKMAQGLGEQFVYLWGRDGVGKTHLLQGVCQFAPKYQKTAFYLSLANRAEITLSMLEGLERLDLICIDDIEAIAGDSAWEEALFHLYNRLRALNHRLLISGNNPAKTLPIKLPDLHSRLSWGVSYQLHPLDDEQLLAALSLRAKERGLELSPEAGAFLIRRCTRSMPQLYLMLDRLDKASLAAQRKLTIPFIKSVLSL